MHDIPVRMISRVTSSSLNNNSWMGSKVIPHFSCWKPSGIYFCNCSMEKRLHKDISLVNEQRIREISVIALPWKLSPAAMRNICFSPTRWHTDPAVDISISPERINPSVKRSTSSRIRYSPPFTSIGSKMDRSSEI